MTEARCPHCEHELTAVALLANAPSYSRSLGLAVADCPGCGQGLEFRPRTGRLAVGYTYWAGSMHFEEVFEIAARGLECREEGDALVCAYRGQVYRLRLDD